MEAMTKACLNRNTRKNYIIKISFVGTISIAGLALCIYSTVTGNYFFALWYLIAFILGLSYSVIRINTAFPAYAACDGDKLILSTWENGVMPYRLPEQPSFISDFIPAKVKTDEIAVSDISAVYIGSWKFLKRNIGEENYPPILLRLDADKHFTNVLRRADFLYVLAKNGENCFMSVTDFDINELAELVNLIEKNCMGVQIHVNIPKLLRMREKIKRT